MPELPSSNIPRAKLSRLFAWLFEMTVEAIGSAWLLGAVTFLDESRLKSADWPMLLLSPALVPLVLAAFVYSGYVFTTLAARMLWRGRPTTYALVAAGLYVFHAQVFFVLAIQKRAMPWDQRLLFFLLGGCMTFCCASVGTKMVFWSARRAARRKTG